MSPQSIQLTSSAKYFVDRWGGEGRKNLEDWKMVLSTIGCVCCGAICCVWSDAYCVIYYVVVDTVYHCIVLYRIAVHLYYCAIV